MSGRDVAIAAILGAEEFGFATAPLVTMGCVMMRVCNLDTCPVGVATQNPELRKRFRGKPEYVVNFMRFIAQELREYMAKFGVRTLDELVGRTDLLKVKDVPTSERASTLNLEQILDNPYEGTKTPMTFNPKKVFDFELEKTLDEKVLVKELLPAVEKKQKRSIEIDVTNTNRTFGTIFGSEITRRYPEGLDEDSYVVHCKGAGGQSFGAFIPKGLTLNSQVTVMTTSVKDCQVVNLSYIRRKESVIKPKRISSSVTLHSTVRQVVRYSSTVWQENDLQCVTPAQQLLWKVSEITDVNI